MSVAAALLAIKTADTPLNTLVSTRFTPDVASQGVTLPFVVFTCEARGRYKSWGVDLPPLSSQTVMMRCYAATSILRTTLVARVLAAFCTTTSQTIGGVTIQGIEIDNQMSGGIEQLGTNTQAYVEILYFKVHVLES